jgi:Spy/CpxP family protein refolding chaperone
MRTFWNSIARPSALVLLAVPLALACHGPRHGMANMSESEVAEHMEDVAEYGLDYVDASDEQIARVNQQLRAAAPEVVKLNAERRALAAELRKELAKDKIDRARIEELRGRALDLFDRATTQAGERLVASAEVLTPEQRRKLMSRWEKHSR